MRHKITAVTCIIIAIVLIALTVQAYNSDKTRQYINSVKASAAQAIQNKLQQHLIEQEKAHIKAECDKETTYYNSLTTKQKTAVEAPNCNLQMVE